MTLSQKVRYIRAERLLSQQEFADAVGVSYSTVSRWEREHRKPQAKAIGKLMIWCKNNGVDLSDVEENYDDEET
ncbi:MAG: helix-turn-helix transcriptional regulator [Clostridia bacterium]|nr:helix-turn-helix transcriptional regulator [Clostridia bacterium]MBQ6885626.1 helix-turn-helix transcriptional regulator [Clostridia bacterium]